MTKYDWCLCRRCEKKCVKFVPQNSDFENSDSKNSDSEHVENWKIWRKPWLKAQSLFCELHSSSGTQSSKLETSIMEVCRKQSLSEKCIEIYADLDKISGYFPDSVEIMQRSGTFGESSSMFGENNDNAESREMLRNRLLGIKGLDDLVDLVSENELKTDQNQPSTDLDQQIDSGLKKTQQS